MKTDQQSWWYKSTTTLSFREALFRIALSTLCISGSAALGLSYYRHLQSAKALDPKYHIVALVQTGPEREQLKTVYLAELLDLSIDRPRNLLSFDVEEAEKKLMATPLIKRATLKKVSPGTVYIDYMIRKPMAFSGDYSNTAIDEEGVLIPFKPFFTPKKLPEIVIRSHSLEPLEAPTALWGTSVAGPEFEQALAIIKYCNEKCASRGSKLTKVDVSNAAAPSDGQREIVLEFEEFFGGTQANYFKPQLFPILIRLNENGMMQSLDRYFLIRDQLIGKVFAQAVQGKELLQPRFDPVVVDLRIADLAFISR